MSAVNMYVYALSSNAPQYELCLVNTIMKLKFHWSNAWQDLPRTLGEICERLPSLWDLILVSCGWILYNNHHHSRLIMNINPLLLSSSLHENIIPRAIWVQWVLCCTYHCHFSETSQSWLRRGQFKTFFCVTSNCCELTTKKRRSLTHNVRK